MGGQAGCGSVSSPPVGSSKASFDSLPVFTFLTRLSDKVVVASDQLVLMLATPGDFPYLVRKVASGMPDSGFLILLRRNSYRCYGREGKKPSKRKGKAMENRFYSDAELLEAIKRLLLRNEGAFEAFAYAATYATINTPERKDRLILGDFLCQLKPEGA